MSLGVGDEDDRQYPERILLHRPDHLLRRFYEDYLEGQDDDTAASALDIDEIPTLVRSRPLIIHDVAMSKLHTAILTTDPVCNLFISGLGRGGRLGLGDENTQFKYVPVQGPLTDKKIHHIALGQNHSMAIAGNGELWTWGLNSDSQLGYLLPPPARADEEPMSLVPRQVFGSIKKEIIHGIAASAIHSVAHTGTSLYCWGRNVGQLALMDADSRSLDIQPTPRKVAASLLTAPITMVSAIDKATTCLLSNHSVWVFTNYGYSLIKFPFPDVFTNHNLTTTSYSNRYGSGRRGIRYIASGGDTIAALTARGDLFTMHVSQKTDSDQVAGSTTNPAKIKGAISQPQCMWDSRKDGAVSVSVGEHGSVIICTETGAVWKRVKRAKGKISTIAGGKRKDFKFERVPYITNCVSVRSSTFGAFSAIRKDSNVMSTEISVTGKSLWDDLGALLCLNDFEAPTADGSNKDHRKAWNNAIVREKPGSVPHELLKSLDIESNLAEWLKFSSFQYDDVDLRLRTSESPDVMIPIHGWLLSARSMVMRAALSQFRRSGTQTHEDAFVVESVGGKPVVTLLHADIMTVLNIVLFLYLDTSLPVWKYTREAPSFAARFRQVRNEVMKFATKLQLPKLESAARLQNTVEPSLNSDLEDAITDKRFFEDGDVILQLDGEDLPVHSQLLCQRCPFFEGMFNGRSQGEWLSGRRMGQAPAERLEIDLQHIQPETFMLVLQYLYADVGEEMFQETAAPSLDEFSEVVLDVMATANELMLDRLSEACQSVIGKFVTIRNIAILLNEISPCSVTEFKDVGLEYICLQLESMLENCHLDGLDEEVLLELDEVVRENQLARLPFVRSGRAELLLHEKYPDLMLDIEEERRRRVKEFAFKNTQREDERKLSASYRTRFGSLGEMAVLSQTPDGLRRKSKSGRNEPFSPSLRPKASQHDMIFDMEEDGLGIHGQFSPEPFSPSAPGDLDVEAITPLPESAWHEVKGKRASSFTKSPSPTGLTPSRPEPRASGQTPSTPLSENRKSSAPWAATSLSTAKLDLRGIMSETSTKSTSALTASLTAQASNDSPASKGQSKMSQKERKKQMQKHAETQSSAQDDKASAKPWQPVETGGKTAPWKAATPIPKTSLQEAMSSDAQQRGAMLAGAKPLVASEANTKSARRRTASPDTRFPGQNRNRGQASEKASPKQQQNSPLVPHSKSYIASPRKSEPALGASMADIIGQQRREQELVKEAVAKRSLQEIQQEQEFQEWWDQESRRAQEEETGRSTKNSSKKDEGGKQRGRRGRGGDGRASKVKEAGKTGTPGTPGSKDMPAGKSGSGRTPAVKAGGKK